MTPRIFRGLLVAHIVSGLLSIVLYFVLQPTLPPPLRDYVASESAADLTTRDLVLLPVALVYLLLWLSALSGLFRLAAWSRPLTVVLLGTGALCMPMFGPASVEPTVSTALAHVSSQLVGAVLAVSYLSPASAWFHNNPRRMRSVAASSA